MSVGFHLVAEPFQWAIRCRSSIWTHFDPNGPQPWLLSLETPVLTQPFLAKMAAVKNVCSWHTVTLFGMLRLKKKKTTHVKITGSKPPPTLYFSLSCHRATIWDQVCFTYYGYRKCASEKCFIATSWGILDRHFLSWSKPLSALMQHTTEECQEGFFEFKRKKKRRELLSKS